MIDWLITNWVLSIAGLCILFWVIQSIIDIVYDIYVEHKYNK
jgi:hypothetical protein